MQNMCQTVKLTPAGSNRMYSRVTREDGSTYIHVVGTSREENHAFITMARHFETLHLPTPRVFAVSDDEMEYDQEDLGDTLLFNDIRPDLLRKTVHALRRLNVEGAKGMDWSVCYPVDSMNRRSIMWDLNYWKYCFLKGTKIEFSEPALENDFDKLVCTLSAAGGLCSVSASGLSTFDFRLSTFLYRDFLPVFLCLIGRSPSREIRYLRKSMGS